MYTLDLYHIVATFHASGVLPMVVDTVEGFDAATRRQGFFKSSQDVSYSIRRATRWF